MFFNASHAACDVLPEGQFYLEPLCSIELQKPQKAVLGQRIAPASTKVISANACQVSNLQKRKYYIYIYVYISNFLGSLHVSIVDLQHSGPASLPVSAKLVVARAAPCAEWPIGPNQKQIEWIEPASDTWFLLLYLL